MNIANLVVTFCHTTGKHSYWSRAIAKLAAKKLRGAVGRKLRPYRCQHCDAWHLTSQGKTFIRQ